MHTIQFVAGISPRAARLLPLSVAIALLPFLIAAPLHAQAPLQNKPVEEIIVTAAKRNQKLEDFTGSIRVITDFSAIDNLSDIANRTPGFSVVDAGPRNPMGLVMRGLRMDEVGANDWGGDGATVASYIDNVPLQGYFVPPASSLKDLQRVEILNGPQGTLYGNASIGGLIRYITNKPDLSRASVSATLGISQTKESDDLNYETDLILNAPIITDSLGVRLLLSKEENQGFIDNPYLLSGAQKDTNDDETKLARLGVLWQATEEFSLTSSYHYQKIRAEDRQASNEEFTGGEYIASNRYLQPMEGELRLASVDASYDFTWATLTASVNSYDYERDTRADQTDYFIKSDEIYGELYTTYDDFSAYTQGDVRVKKDSAELRLVSPDKQSFRWLLGAFYSEDDLSVSIADVVPGFAEFVGLDRPDGIDYYATQTEDLREQALYAEVAYDLTPTWEASLGLRGFRYEDDVSSCWAYPILSGIEGRALPLSCYENSDDHTGSLGKFSTRYKINSDHTVYFTLAEGFRRGGVNLVPDSAEENRAYAPDTAVNYELGSRNDFFDGKLHLSGAVFYIDWRDFQIVTVSSEGHTVTANAEDARSYGVELDGKVQLNHAWSLRAGMSLTEAELAQDAPNLTGVGIDAFTGDTLPGSPRYQWSIGTDYSHVFANSANLTAGFILTRKSEIYTALNDGFYNYTELGGFSTADIHLGVTLRNWHFRTFITNITNTRGITGIRTNELYAEQGAFEYVTRPRTLGVSVNYTY